jgi:hypothetical protein
MESRFGAPTKEKIYKTNSAELTVKEVKQMIRRYAFVYYNRQLVTSVNDGGWLPLICRERTTVAKSAACTNLWCFGTELLLTVLNYTVC